jgi:release factor glutamine methyltransferase
MAELADGESVSIGEALHWAVALLKERRVGVPRLTAEVLLADVLAAERPFLYSHPEVALSADQSARFEEAVSERCGGKPTQYITGKQEFYGLSFAVSPETLIPRPETELLVEEALGKLSGNGAVLDRVLDLGTGSGCIAVAIKKHRPGARVLACDLSLPALRVANDNARRLEADIELIQADLTEAFRQNSFGTVVCNPPYVPLADLPGLQRELRFEPARALFGGEDGLAFYRRLGKLVGRVLRPGGWLLVELGYRGRAAVEEMFSSARWEAPQVRADLAGMDRVLMTRKR